MSEHCDRPDHNWFRHFFRRFDWWADSESDDEEVPATESGGTSAGNSNNNAGEILSTGSILGGSAEPEKQVVSPVIPDGCSTVRTNKLKVDYHLKTNSFNHKTDDYDLVSDLSTLVVRRASKVKFTVDFSGLYLPNGVEALKSGSLNLEYDDLGICQMYTACEINFTKVICSFDESDKEDGWFANFTSLDNDTRIGVIELSIPSTAIIGKYNLAIATSKSDKFCSKFDKPIYIMFNPYSSLDTVYMKNADEQKEYVENEEGGIFTGSKWRSSLRRWNFGHFDAGMMEACLRVLLRDRRQKTQPFRNIPKLRHAHYVCRVLTAAVGEFVLVGNWSGDYADGASPTSWNGSVKIIQQAMKTKKPTKFGQCWVFSGVLTTLCRSVGVPTRSVTCFASAHDTDESMTIDHYTDVETNDPIEYMNRDSVWNFHVWNEVWMSRPDFGNKVDYDGWQVIDATPQEESFGLYQCGPAPVKAIKQGQIDCGYEAPFIFGEVNADRHYWVCRKDVKTGRYAIEKLASKRTGACGANISTKRVGNDSRHEVTKYYKFAEGTDAERDAFAIAYSLGKGDTKFGDLDGTKETVDIAIDIEGDVSVGDNVTITMNCTPWRDGDYTYVAGVYACITLDRGETDTKNLIERFEGTVPMKSKTKTSFSVECSALKYFKRLENGNALTFSIIIIDKKRDSVSREDVTFVLDPPKDTIKLSVSSSIEVQKPFEVTVTVTNPFEIPLTNCVLSLEGSFMSHSSKNIGTLGVGETKSVNMTLTPKKKGNKRIIVDFDSKEIQDIKAHYVVTVAE